MLLWLYPLFKCLFPLFYLQEDDSSLDPEILDCICTKFVTSLSHHTLIIAGDDVFPLLCVNKSYLQ